MDLPQTMKAMVLEEQRKPLILKEVPVPRPGPGQVLVRVEACGVCRTDLHILDGDLPRPKLPLIMGHQIAGRVVGAGEKAARFTEGDRVGIPWLGYTDDSCPYCRRGQENLCDHPLFMGYTMDGGYAQYAVAYERYSFPLPESYDDLEVAPLLCAGLIGFRTYRLAGEHKDRLGIYGFGSAAHIISQVAIHQGKKVFAFTKPGDTESQDFARKIGVAWAGGSDERPPEPLDAALVFAPVGPLMVEALKNTAKGGTVISGGIHMSDIPAFPYSRLWEERSIRSVANLTRQDAEDFLRIAPEVPVKVKTNLFALEEANRALDELRAGEFEGSAVLVIGDRHKKR
jgi:propanol-preferring alcohol dehydrogenase